MAKISFDDALLVLKGWRENDTSLFVAASEQPAEFISRASIVELTEGGILLKSSDGGVQFRMGFSTPDEMSCWYFEPREFSEREEFKKMASTLSEREKLSSSLGFKFFRRVDGPNIEALSIPIGEVVFVEIVE